MKTLPHIILINALFSGCTTTVPNIIPEPQSTESDISHQSSEVGGTIKAVERVQLTPVQKKRSTWPLSKIVYFHMKMESVVEENQKKFPIDMEIGVLERQTYNTFTITHYITLDSSRDYTVAETFRKYPIRASKMWTQKSREHLIDMFCNPKKPLVKEETEQLTDLLTYEYIYYVDNKPVSIHSVTPYEDCK